MKVLLVTSWGKVCGIACHSEQLIAAVQQADPSIEITPSEEALDPTCAIPHLMEYDVLHLNFHRALHSRWDVNTVHRVRQMGAVKLVITFHDTFGESQPDPLTTDLCDLADAFIVHEPCVGLPKAIYWRQGVPPLNGLVGLPHPQQSTRPILGSVGFDFGWKNYDRLAILAAAAGWGVLLYVPEMSLQRLVELDDLNPWMTVRINQPTHEVVAGLRECDATAFLYVNGNSGTSAAIRLGIAAKKPVIAYSTCRQFRDLYQDPLAHQAILWATSEDDVRCHLTHMTLGRFDTGIVALAQQDSWTGLGQRYAQLYRSLVA